MGLRLARQGQVTPHTGPADHVVLIVMGGPLPRTGEPEWEEAPKPIMPVEVRREPTRLSVLGASDFWAPTNSF